MTPYAETSPARLHHHRERTERWAEARCRPRGHPAIDTNNATKHRHRLARGLGRAARGAAAAAKPKPAATPAPAPRASSFDAGDAWDANDDLDDILGDGWDDDSPTSKSVSPPPRSLSSLSGAVSPGEDSDDDFFASLGMESKPKFRK